MIDLVQTLQALQTWKVSILAMNGLQFDLTTPYGKLIASVLASLAEFERDLLRERVRSGLAAAKARESNSGASLDSGRNPTDWHPGCWE